MYTYIGIYIYIYIYIYTVHACMHACMHAYAVTLPGQPGRSTWQVSLAGQPGRSTWQINLPDQPAVNLHRYSTFACFAFRPSPSNIPIATVPRASFSAQVKHFRLFCPSSKRTKHAHARFWIVSSRRR